MNKITSVSFSILKFTSLGFIILYLLIIVLVGAAGHGSGDYVSFLGITGFSLLIFLLINDYQKRITAGKRIKSTHRLLFAILLLSTIGISLASILGLLSLGFGIGVVVISMIPALYAISGLLVLRHLLRTNAKS